MKRIGILGGMSWESTAVYYRRINQMIAERKGGFHSADIALASIDFAAIEAMQSRGAWKDAGMRLATSARELESVCADCVIMSTNTMHKVADAISRAIQVPFIHIADAVADDALRRGLTRLGLLGTRFTMEERFYIERLEAKGLSVMVPEEAERREVDRVIYEELVRGQFRNESKTRVEAICRSLAQRGAEGVIEGCTEIGMLLDPEKNDLDVPLLDSTEIHCKAAVEFSLSE